MLRRLIAAIIAALMTPRRIGPDSGLARDLSGIAVDVDFKPYLAAVTDASQRARSTLYVLVVALIAIFAAYRNTLNPDWLDTRLQQLQIAEACLTKVARDDPRCDNAERYARQFVYHPSQRGKQTPLAESFAATPPGSSLAADLPESEAHRELHQAIDLLMRQRTENLSVRVPILGLVMDMNDMGLIAGIALFAVIYIFRLTLTREGDNLVRAQRKAASLRNKDNFELLLMAQVFSAPPTAHTGTSGVFNVFFLLPALLYGAVVFEDAGRSASRTAGSLLIGETLFAFQMAAEMTLLLFIIWQSARAWQQWRRNDERLAEIHKDHADWSN